MEEILKHPLVVLAIGAILSGILIPAFTRQWQNRQKELELKTDLISELSETIMGIIMSVQFVHVNYMSQGVKDFDTGDMQKEFNEAYREWEIKSAVLGTKLEAYFSETEPELPTEWRAFSDIVTKFYALEGIHDNNEKENNALDVAKKLFGLIDPKAPFSSDWQALRNGIMEKKCDIIQKVLKADISVFQSGLFGKLW